jgi:hypothetical protein
MGKGFTKNSDDRFTKFSIFLMSVIISLVGCATTAMETHKQGMESLTEKEYFIP